MPYGLRQIAIDLFKARCHGHNSHTHTLLYKNIMLLVSLINKKTILNRKKLKLKRKKLKKKMQHTSIIAISHRLRNAISNRLRR